MEEPVTIALGGRRFALRPLTIGQFRAIYPVLFKGAELGSAEGFDAALRCLAAALGRDHPEMSFEALLGLEAGIDELAAAFVAVMRLSGLSPGEAGAGASAGPRSTAG